MPKTHHFFALGTEWWIKVFHATFKPNIFGEIEKVVSGFEQMYSRFLPSSVVSKLNSDRMLSSPPKELVDMLLFAGEIFRLSQGHFNVCLGKALESKGYDPEYSFVEKEVGSKVPEGFLDVSEEKVTLPEGANLDLGGMGKGWLIDKVVSVLKKRGVRYFIVNAGGDAYVTSDCGEVVYMDLEHPIYVGKSMGKIAVKDAAVGCSAANRRTWTDPGTGRQHHHLISPKQIKNNILAVFTHAPSALLADVASTVIFVSNPQIAKIINQHLGVEFMIVLHNGQIVTSKSYPGELHR